MKDSNRRHFPREDRADMIQALLIRNDLEGPEDSGDLIPAKMVNQSDNGLFLEINRDLAPGALVRIKKILQAENCFEEACYTRDGRVTRCEVLDGTASHFGLGIQVLSNVIQGHILTSRFN